ncbi:hypothetical protein AMS68_002469 [Peltaster fructicola]|uniref:Uncharacterized protein n=1 Tax=Peltaster fructicola TaxID=286661 RepID=A0A6H0XQA7_9PEZI|nr:hypothetical protein AMS68_002469 [Peltaster fructicola]
MNRLDLRIHIGASTTEDADRAYAAQAAAYLDFRPANVTHLKRDDIEHLATASDEQDQITTAGGERQQSRIDGENSDTDRQSAYLRDTQLAITALDSQLFSIPAPLERSQKRAHQAISRSSSEPIETAKGVESLSDDAHESNSSHLKTPVIHRQAKRRRLGVEDTLTRQVTVTNVLPSDPVHILNQHLSQDTAAVTPIQHRTERSSTSQLPTTYSLSDITSDRTRSDPSLQRSVSDPGPQAAAPEDASTVSETNTPSILHNPTRVSRVLSSGATDRQKAIGESIRATRDKMHDVKTIHPPSPRVSVDHFQTHVTRQLRELVDDPRTSGLYHPTEIKRELRPLERGHWRFCNRSWPVALRERFWAFMSDFVGVGRAGWGVWCVWTIDDEDSEDGDVVLTHCWGEIAKHIYLLLYVASQSKVRKLGLQWIDADGKVIVQMRGPSD